MALLSETTPHTRAPTVKETLATSMFTFFKKGTDAIESTTTYKNTTRGLYHHGYTLTRYVKRVKRVVLGEGEIMKLYRTLRGYFDSGDIKGLQLYIAYIELYQPKFGSAKQEKKKELIAYGHLLMSIVNGEDIREQVKVLSDHVDLRHEVGRKIKADLQVF